MTKRNLVDLIIHRLAGGSVSSDLIGKYHVEVVAKFASTAMNSVFFDLFRSNESLLDMYTKDYTVSIVEDTALDAYYSTLPAQIVQLPGNAGIRMITPKQDPSTIIPVVPSLSVSSLSNLEVCNICDTMYGFLVNDKVYYRNKFDDFTVVLMKLVVPLEEYAWTDEIYLPSGKGMEIVNMVSELMLNMPPEDMKNDNNSERS